MDVRLFGSFRSYAVGIAIMVVVVLLTVVPMQSLMLKLLKDAVSYDVLGKPMPLYEQYACWIFLAPIEVLNYFLLERIRPSFGDDYSRILIFWTQLIGIFWSVLFALPVAATGVHISRTEN